MGYNIKNDTGHPWRLNKFMEFHNNSDENIDLQVLRRWCEIEGYDDNQRIWLAAIYTTTLSAPISALMSKYTPVDSLSDQLIETMWKKYPSHIKFPIERANYNRWFTAIGTLQELYHRSQDFNSLSDYINNLTVLGNAEETFNTMSLDFVTMPFFNKILLKLFPRALSYLLDINLDFPEPNWKHLGHPTSGLMAIIYKDSEAIAYDDSKVLYSATRKQLSNIMHAVRVTLAEQYPEASLRTMDIVGSLGNFYKLFLQRIYLGYWIDSQLDSIMRCRRAFPKLGSAIWSVLLDIRSELLPREVLGERNDWLTIRRYKTKQWIDKGVM